MLAAVEATEVEITSRDSGVSLLRPALTSAGTHKARRMVLLWPLWETV